MKKKIFYVVSDIQKSLAFEWTADGLKNSYDLTFVLLNPSSSPLESYLKANSVNVIRLNYRGKIDAGVVFFRLCFLFMKARPTVVHCHLLDASIIGLLASWTIGISKRVYTRHHSTFHHVYFPGAVKYDRWTNRLSTHIISISQATDFALVQLESVSKNKIRKVPHGFKLDAFAEVGVERINDVRSKWSIPHGAPCIGVVARHVEWKGVQYIVPAFERFLRDYPDACLIMVNAFGPYHNEILALLANVPKKNLVIIPFDNDVAALYKLFDMYVHVPVDSTIEAFGQTYVEALASGVPSIFTLSGIAREWIKDGVHASVVDFKNPDAIFIALKKLWTDKNLQDSLRNAGRKSIDPAFALPSMIHRLEELYGE